MRPPGGNRYGTGSGPGLTSAIGDLSATEQPNGEFWSVEITVEKIEAEGDYIDSSAIAALVVNGTNTTLPR